jgi:hypothetical protein
MPGSMPWPPPGMIPRTGSLQTRPSPKSTRCWIRLAMHARIVLRRIESRRKTSDAGSVLQSVSVRQTDLRCGLAADFFADVFFLPSIGISISFLRALRPEASAPSIRNVAIGSARGAQAN